MDMDLAVAIKSCRCCDVKKKKIRSNSLLNEAKKLDKQNMLKEQITMMKDQMKI
jgi:hypothetical protein